MITYTGGSFDLFHIGHLELLEACRDLAGIEGRVVVSLNTDAFIETYKGKPPVQPYTVRAEMLWACRYVDMVVANVGGADSRVAIDVVHPDVLVIGDDWLDPGRDERRYHAQLGVDPDWLKARGLNIVYVPRTRGTSTSDIRELIAARGFDYEEQPSGYRIENGRVVRT